MSTPQEGTPGLVDELARKRQEREASRPDELELRDRVREESRRAARRSAAAERARRRSGSPTPPPDPNGSGGGASGAA